jgi:hypothetical protein
MINSAVYIYNEFGNKVYIDATYSDGVTRTVPINEANRHYQDILEWVENGGVIVDNGS